MEHSLPLIEYHNLEDQVKAMDRDGYVYFPNVLKAQEIAELKAGMDALEPIEENFDHYSTSENHVGNKNKEHKFYQKMVIFLLMMYAGYRM